MAEINWILDSLREQAGFDSESKFFEKPKTLRDWLFLISFVLLIAALAIVVLVGFWTGAGYIIRLAGMVFLLASILLMLTYFVTETWYRTLRLSHYPRNQRGWIRQDLDMAPRLIDRLRDVEENSLRTVRRYLDLAIENRRGRLALGFGAIEKVGLIPALASGALAWSAQFKQGELSDWAWISIIFQGLVLCTVQLRRPIEELTVELWLIDEVLHELYPR